MILVTGATGSIGSEVVRTLRRLNLAVRALVRKGSEYYWLNDTGCGYFFGDLRDRESLLRSMREVRHVIACSGVRTETRDNNLRNVVAEGHAALFEACKARGVEKVVLVSCVGLDRGLGVPSFEARKGAEDALKGSGLEYAILRACLTERPLLELAWRVRDRGRVVLPGPGTNRLSPIPAVDVARMAAASLDLAAARNRTLEVGGADSMTAREAFDLACAVVGVEPRATVLPRAAVEAGKRLGRPVRRFANRLSEMAVWFREELAADDSYAQFGFAPTPLRAAMEETAARMAWMRDPAERERRMVHPQFYATVYEPGTARIEDLPTGPPPRRD